MNFIYFLFILIYFISTNSFGQIDSNGVQSISKEEKEWLRSVIIPFKSYELNSSNEDIAGIKEINENVGIIGLGEATHGASQIHKMKSKIVKYLVEYKNFNVLSIEAPMVEAYALNDYINEGRGDVVELLHNMMLWPWETEEFIALIEWIKEYNKKHGKKVTLIGFDMCSYQGPINDIGSEKELKKDSVFILKLSSIKSTLNHLYNLSRHISDTLHSLCDTDMKMCFDSIETRITSINISSRRKQWLLQDLVLLKQYYFSFTDKKDILLRDKFMSQNFLWIRKWMPNKKIIIWAHNEHVSKNEKHMGKYIYDSEGLKYLNISFGFYHGDYNAYVRESGKFAFRACKAEVAYPGTYEYYFSSIDVPLFAFCFARDSLKCHYFNTHKSNLKFRIIGAVKHENEFDYKCIQNEYDYIVYFKKVSPSSILKKHG